MYENVEKWIGGRLGLGDGGRPVVFVIQNDEDNRAPELDKVFEDMEVKALETKKRKTSSASGPVQNRRWQILEEVKQNEPTTQSAVAEALGMKNDSVNYMFHHLTSKDWLKKEDNVYFEDSRARNVYFLGYKAKSLMEKHNISSFLYPDNPYDEGPNGERREEIIKMKMRK